MALRKVRPRQPLSPASADGRSLTWVRGTAVVLVGLVSLNLAPRRRVKRDRVYSFRVAAAAEAAGPGASTPTRAPAAPAAPANK